MKKFAGISYDVTDLLSDGRIEYLVSLTQNDPDDLIKNAHIPSKDEVEAMPAEDFAVVLYHSHNGFLKKFACHDKYVTKLNMKILQDTHQDYPDEISKTASYFLTKAAKHFRLDVPDSLKKLAEGKHVTNIVDLDDIDRTQWHKKHASQIKIVEPKEFALPDARRYPLDTGTLVKTAVNYFEKHATHLSPLDAVTYALNVKKAAKKLNITTEDTRIEKYAALTASHFNDDYKELIRSRRIYVTEDNRGVYDELVEKAGELGVIKTAEVLEQVDRKFEVNRQWGHDVVDPYLSVLGIKKEASCTHKGKKIKVSMLKKAAEGIVDPGTLRDLDGPEAAFVFDSLPTPIKDKISKNI